MYNLEELIEDRQAELNEVSYIDSVNYTGLKIIGMYHDTDEKAIVQHTNGKISMYKLYYSVKNDDYYFNYCNRRMYLNNFLKAY